MVIYFIIINHKSQYLQNKFQSIVRFPYCHNRYTKWTVDMTEINFAMSLKGRIHKDFLSR